MFSNLNEGQWGDVHLGADGGVRRVPCRAVFQQHGNHVHAYAKFRLPTGQVVMAHASTDLAAMEREIDAEVLRRLQLDPRYRGGGASSGGWFKRAFRKAKRALKKVAKKTGIVKVLKAVHKVAQKALDNKWVQGALASNPWGAAFLAARKATQVAFKAFKGSKLGKMALGKLARLAKGGSKKARNVLGLMSKSIKKNPKFWRKRNPRLYDALAKLPSHRACVAGDAEIDALIEGCVDYTEPATSGEYYAIMGADADAETREDLDFLETFASSGAFEGARWLVDRLGPHTMDAHPDELTARGALLWGRSAQAQRFPGH